MEILGIKFVPWNAPLKERLETLGAAGAFLNVMTFSILGPYLIYFLLFHSKYWLIAVLYLVWLYVFDKDTPEQGGRSIEWFRSWKLWKYAKDYFPIALIKYGNMDLDPRRNYLFATFPHGIIPIGAGNAFGTQACGFQNLFPHHKPHSIALDPHFKLPIYRDVFMSFGCCASSKKSLNFILGNPRGGNVAVLFVGGVSEALNAHPGTYNLVLRNRKGFVKLALQNGSPIVPVFSFGENDVYTTVSNPHGSWLRRYQEWCKQKMSISPLIFNGRGFFQYSFGIIPKQTPINVVVGKPIEVVQVENPTEKDVEELHSTFVEELIKLFEENKYKYEKNPDKVKIVIT